MSILQRVVDKMQTILQTVPDEAAVDSGLVKRKRKLTGSALTQILDKPSLNFAKFWSK